MWNNSNRKGFAVIEVLAALLILAVGILGLAFLTSNTVQGYDQSNELAVATILAQEKIEELKWLGYDDLKLREGTYTDPSSSFESDGDGAVGFIRRWEILQDNTKVNIKIIRVTVFWTNSGERSIIMSTMIGKG